MNRYIFNHGALLLERRADGGYALPNDNTVELDAELPVQHWGGETFVAAEMAAGSELPETLELIPLRATYALLPLHVYRLAEKARELLDWNRETLHCGHCGALQEFRSPISKFCPQCKTETWPKLSPACIVLIERGEELLLVQSRDFKREFFGLVAGFVETGESLEECVRREVKEETQIEIKNIRYFGSQPWPFPRNLMIGFWAEYAGGELSLQDAELRKGGWFHRDALPAIPERPSIARQMIDAWLKDKHSI